MEEKDPLPPVNQYIYLVDNRQDSRIIKITDNKSLFTHLDNSDGGKLPSQSKISPNSPSLPS